MSDDKNKVEEIKKHLDEKIEEATKAAIEQAKIKREEAAEELSVKQEELHGEIKELAEKLDEAYNEIDDVKVEMEKAGAIGKDQRDAFTKAFNENKEKISEMAAKAKSQNDTARFQVNKSFLEKATMTTGGSLDDRDVIRPERTTQTPVFDPESRPIRDYIMTGTISTDSAEWPIEQTADGNTQYDYDNNAAAVDSDSAAQKPESELSIDLENRTVRDIAHTFRLHKNLMNDLPLLQSYLPARLRDGLLREESRQILRGQDSNQELVGITQTGSHLVFDETGFQAALANTGKTLSESNFIDVLGYAMTQLRIGNYSPSRILLNPEDFYSFMFSVDNDGDYHMNQPVWQYVASLVAQNNYVNQDEFFVMDGRRATTLFQRENMNVEFSYEDRDNFVKNLVTIRAEERAVLVTERPNGIIYGAFSTATS